MFVRDGNINAHRNIFKCDNFCILKIRKKVLNHHMNKHNDFNHVLFGKTNF